MAQNIYDNDEFFAGYSQLERSISGLKGAPEWPALRALVPDLRDRRVLDLGCGFGWFCRWAVENGAAYVLGVDFSEKMLARARGTTQDTTITYERADLETITLPRAAFDFVYSSLTLHYIVNLDKLLAKTYDALTPGGSFVFSVEHPMYTAPSNPAWMHCAEGRAVWPIDNYLHEGPRSTDWLAAGVIKQHRTIGTYMNMLIGAGFTLTHVEEWAPTKEQIEARPEWANERHRPPFLLVRAKR
jgi:SAM-dependent methyltransferase